MDGRDGARRSRKERGKRMNVGTEREDGWESKVGVVVEKTGRCWG